ncbi:hypothetical protein [Mucilaginibacter sp. CSA2-8R]|uniref:hypothetical protein n=1 Tax=Mucilaginibacter sp. CSA2-8R TaxID=3141542 RepID=UPI00315C73FD
MKTHYLVCLILLCLGCTKTKQAADKVDEQCDMPAIYRLNTTKVNITNGVWGTVSITQGDCMPTFGGKSSCSTCAIQREVRIYEYTKNTDAVRNKTGGPFYDSFKTKLIQSVQTDNKGFYQATLPDGVYSIIIVEKGLLYAYMADGLGGLSPFTVSRGKVKADLTLNYAVY